MSDAALDILTDVILSVVSMAVSYIIHRLIMRSINKFTSTIGKEVKAPKTLSVLIAFLVYGFGIAAILSIWDIDLAPYLAGLGISGVVLGLAFQEPLTNFLSGILVLVTRKVFEGEVVDIDGQTGTVDVLKMNNTLLRTFDGKLVLIPNRKVWSGTVTKFWPTNFRRIELNVTVDYKSDMEKVIALLKRAIEEEPLVVKNDSVSNSVVFKSFDSNGITYTVMFWTERAMYFDSLNALTIRIKKIFDENGISIPNSVIDVRIKNIYDAEGNISNEKIEKIRNICIIAHIDHGKTTLTDRILEMTNSVEKRKMREQYLDSMDIERERGITIKSHPLRVFYTADDGNEYEINIVDTPGHVDFSYEVDRSMAAVEGAILLVDATQGVQAQTVANTYKAIEHNLEIVPAVNKIDMPLANIDETVAEIEDLIGIPSEDIFRISAKEGVGVKELLEAVIRLVPAPKTSDDGHLRALIFDAKYDKYRGAVTYVRVFDGEIKPGDKIKMMMSDEIYEVIEVGTFAPEMMPAEKLGPGDIGYVIAGLKDVSKAKIGDTITKPENPTQEPLPGYKEVKPMVYAGMYPGLPEYYEELRKALDKYKLNDAAIIYRPDHSPALGFGFRCGFLGLLHMDVVRERLEREYEMAVILTAPNVEYKLVFRDGREITIDDPAKFPDEEDIAEIYEPYVKLSIITPPEYIGRLMNLVQNEKRGTMISTENAGHERVVMHFEVPLAEIIFDFFDRMKAVSRGYASMDYEYIEHRKSELVKISIYVNKEPVDALSFIAHRSKAYDTARRLVDKLADLIPQHQFEIPIQAKADGRFIARSTVRALRKDVLAKCYGGDITRKMKLLEKQKEGKKKLREIGNVSIPQEAFLAMLRIGEDEEK